jgi:hypothetical protein
MLRPLFITDELKAEVKRVLDFASGNFYYPGKSETIPGDDPRHVLEIPTGYRCVFSITISPQGKPWRHLSISVPKKGAVPHPISAFVIAALFGFTGYDIDRPSPEPPADWFFDLNREDNCVIIAQEKQ